MKHTHTRTPTHTLTHTLKHVIIQMYGEIPIKQRIRSINI